MIIISSTIKTTILVLFILLFSLPLTLLANTANVPKSGQTISYVNGDDGDLQRGVSWPSPRFTVNSNGTVTDTLTNLIWLKNADCFGDITWDNALTEALALGHGSCSLLDGSSAQDWRIPNIRELESLIHVGVYSPAVPDTEGAGKATSGNPFNSLQLDDYWTSSTNPAIPSDTLAVKIKYGHIVSKPKGGKNKTMFVRDRISGTPAAEVYTTGQTLCYSNDGTLVNCGGTGQDGDLRKGMTWPVPRFTDNNDGTVHDNLTELTWLKDANCQGTTNWTNAITFANQLGDGNCGLHDDSTSSDWRLPNRKELLSLLNFSFYSPALSDTSGSGQWQNEDPFTDVQSTSGYWTSTTYIDATSHAWYINFTSGITGTDGKTRTAYAWPVRNNLVTPITVTITGDGSGTITSSPEGIDCPDNCSFEFISKSTVTLTPHADMGSEFIGWSQGSCGKNKSCQVTASAPTTISATFTKNQATPASWMILLTR